MTVLFNEISRRQTLLVQRQCRRRLSLAANLPQISYDRNLPDFVIVGAAKAGTTTLLRTLQQHPRITAAAIKEPDFFSVDQMYSLGLNWYRSLFQDHSPDQLLGEASTSYSRLPLYPETAQRLYDANPSAKIIYIKREPVTRTYSHLIHRWSRELFPGTPFPSDFTPFLNADLIPVTSSLYEYQLRPWISRFGDSQVMEVSFERMTATPASECSRIFRFLGLEDFVVSKLRHENSTLASLAHSKADRWIGKKTNGAAGRIGHILLPFGALRRQLYFRCLVPLAGVAAKHQNPPPPLTADLRNRISIKIEQALLELSNES